MVPPESPQGPSPDSDANFVGSSTPASYSSSATLPDVGSAAPVAGSSAPVLDLGAPATSSAPSSTPPPRARTRLQNQIVKPKKLFPRMIRYANYCSTIEPELLHEALNDPCGRKQWMKNTPLLCTIKHGTWSL
jgi:hypothetical protein